MQEASAVSHRKQTILSERTTTAISLFGKGFNCAQYVLSAFSDDFDLEETDALRAAGMLGAGMGHMDKVCGAIIQEKRIRTVAILFS
jgi:hypothetical protein